MERRVRCYSCRSERWRRTRFSMLRRRWFSTGFRWAATVGGRRVNVYSVVWDLKVVGETLTDEQGRDVGGVGWMLEDFKKSSGIILWESGATDGGAVVVEYGRVKGVVSPVELSGEVSDGGRAVVCGQWHRVVLAPARQAHRASATVPPTNCANLPRPR